MFITDSEQTFKTDLNLVKHILNRKPRPHCGDSIHIVDNTIDIRKTHTSI